MKNKILKIFLFCAFLLSANQSFAAFTFKSNDIKSGADIPQQHIFNGFGCSGGNLSPQLQIGDIPAGTKSLAITMFDPNAPTGSGWWHWIAYNIDPTVTVIETGTKQISQNTLLARNDYGDYAYGGPCPPVGSKHNYIFTLYALDVTKLDVPLDASAALIGYNLNSHVIEKRLLTATYWRKK